MSNEAFYAEANARLLYRLLQTTGAIGFGSISGFFEVFPEWRCPCCHRSKEEIVRLDKNAHLLCSIHWHHDHFLDLAREKIGPIESSVEDSFCRFPRTQICSDCNVAESTLAKRSLNEDEKRLRHFSFAPFEIASFIIVRMNAGHSVDVERAQIAYQAAQPSMKLLGDRLRAVVQSIRTDADTFEQVGGAAWRVLKEVNAKRKAQQS